MYRLVLILILLLSICVTPTSASDVDTETKAGIEATAPQAAKDEGSTFAELVRRQVVTNACATVSVFMPRTITELCTQVPGLAICSSATGAVTLTNVLNALGSGPLVRLCLCLKDGALTQQSLNDIEVAITASGTTITTVRTLLGLSDLRTIVRTLAPGLIRSAGAGGCTYPTHSTPTCSTTVSCYYICDTGYKACNAGCILQAATCPTSGLRRRVNPADLNCPLGFTACPIPGAKAGGRFECIDTRSNIESCGGCISPFPGQAKGTDCTTAPYAMDVACVEGMCQISTCQKGFFKWGEWCYARNRSLQGGNPDEPPKSDEVESGHEHEAEPDPEVAKEEARAKKKLAKKAIKTRQTSSKKILAKHSEVAGNNDRLNSRRSMGKLGTLKPRYIAVPPS